MEPNPSFRVSRPPGFPASDLPDTPFEALPPEATWEDLVRRARALRGPTDEEDRQILARKLRGFQVSELPSCQAEESQTRKPGNQETRKPKQGRGPK